MNYTCGDFIITDIHMPSMTGLDFIENQLRQGGCKSMNFAVMSADWTDLQLQQAKRLGCYVLKKPFDPQELIDWLVECEKKIDPKRKLSDWFKFKDKKTSH
ncbi:MAG TPA: response regulator [Candidatus Omnitrophica bacterium]|nr:response regulator [Candidatus Omnitrophota bacterium]